MSDPFPRPGLVFILGTLGSRKTWLGLNLALSAAAASRWQDLPFASTPSLFIDYEQGETMLWGYARSVILSTPVSKNTPFYFAHHPELDLQAVALTAVEKQLGFIVLDSPFGYTPIRTVTDVLKQTASPRALNDVAQQLQATFVVLLHTHKRRTSIGSALLAAGATTFWP